MQHHQANALLALCEVLWEYADVIEALAAEGKAGVGPRRYFPLPSPQRERVCEAVGELRKVLSEMLHFLSEATGEKLKLEGPKATAFVIRARVEKMEDMVEEAEPERIARKYGPLAEEEIEVLREFVGRVRTVLSNLKGAAVFLRSTATEGTRQGLCRR